MAAPRIPMWPNLPNAICFLLLLLLLLQLTKSEATFVGKESCGFESSEVLNVSSKMWIMSGSDPAEATTSVGQKLYFPPHSVFKVNIRKDNTTQIEAQHPHVMIYKLSNVSQLHVVSGDMIVSCLNDRRRAENELGVVEKATDSSSSGISSETDQSSTPLPEDVASATVIFLSPRSLKFENSSTDSSSGGMQNSTSNVEITTKRTTLHKETTKQALIPDKPVTPNTTNAKVSTPSTTRKTSVETIPAAATTPFVVSKAEEEKSGTEEETSIRPFNIPTAPVLSLDNETPTDAPVPATETSEAQTTTVSSSSGESQSHSSIEVEPESTKAPFKAEDHIPYFAACGVLLFITVVVAAIICIVQRRRSRRRSLDNHEDLFITSTYDEMLIRNNESLDGRSSRVMMYGDEPVALDPFEVEVRILGGNNDISEHDDEKPRCLADP